MRKRLAAVTAVIVMAVTGCANGQWFGGATNINEAADVMLGLNRRSVADTTIREREGCARMIWSFWNWPNTPSYAAAARACHI